MSVTITFTDPTPEEVDNLLGYLFNLDGGYESDVQPEDNTHPEQSTTPVVEKKTKEKKPTVVKEEQPIIGVDTPATKSTYVLSSNEPLPNLEPPLGTPSSKAPSREDIHSLCLELVRKDTGNKEKIKGVLSHFKAKLIKDVPDAEWESFASCITELQ